MIFKISFNKTYQSIQNWPFMLLTDDLHYEVWGNCLLFDRDEMSYQVIFLFSIFLTIPLTDLCLAFHNEEINFQTRLTSLLSYWVSKKDLRKYSLTTSYCWTTVFLSLNCWVFFVAAKVVLEILRTSVSRQPLLDQYLNGHMLQQFKQWNQSRIFTTLTCSEWPLLKQSECHCSPIPLRSSTIKNYFFLKWIWKTKNLFFLICF